MADDFDSFMAAQPQDVRDAVDRRFRELRAEYAAAPPAEAPACFTNPATGTLQTSETEQPIRESCSKAEAPAERGEMEALREALADLISWFPDAPAPAEWRIPAGGSGADDAIAAAHAALGHKTCRFCGWRGTPETAADPYTTDGTVEVCGGCNNAESCA